MALLHPWRTMPHILLPLTRSSSLLPTGSPHPGNKLCASPRTFHTHSRRRAFVLTLSPNWKVSSPAAAASYFKSQLECRLLGICAGSPSASHFLLLSRYPARWSFINCLNYLIHFVVLNPEKLHGRSQCPSHKGDKLKENLWKPSGT